MNDIITLFEVESFVDFLDLCLTLSIISMIIFTVSFLADSHLKIKKQKNISCFISIILFVITFVTFVLAPFLYFVTFICFFMYTIFYGGRYGEFDQLRTFIFMAVVLWGFLILDLDSALCKKEKNNKEENHDNERVRRDS